MIIYPNPKERGRRINHVCLLELHLVKGGTIALGVWNGRKTMWYDLPHDKPLVCIINGPYEAFGGVVGILTYLRRWMTPGQKSAITRLLRGYPDT